jgi:RNA polymerase sigma factor (sigma-70 family)
MTTAQTDPLLRHIRHLAAGRCSPECTDRQLLDEFSAHRDEAAFAALVARHGPMVLRLCRRVLNHEQDAEDAFQATFLVLARNTRSIRKRGSLSSWLYGVANRTAMELKRKAARRRNHEARLFAMVSKAAVRPTWDDVQAVLDEEIQRLPETFRTAFVLCVLEGKTGPEAARELDVREGTVSSRLARARQRLQKRLTRRGIKLSALLAALSLTEVTSSAAVVPSVLATATIRAGLLVAAGGIAAGTIPADVAALAAAVTRAMFLTKAKTALMISLALAVLSGVGVWARQTLPVRETAPLQAVQAKATVRAPGRLAQTIATDKSGPAAINDRKDETLKMNGRVVGPDGGPVAGAELYLTPWMGYLHEPFSSAKRATTGPDGRFEFTVPKKDGNQGCIVAAAAANHGAAWVQIPAGGRRDDLTVRLAVDDVPIAGQIVDLQAKPVAGATLRVLQINAAPEEDLRPWLEAVIGRKGPVSDPSLRLEQKYLSRFTIAPSWAVTTDADGRFQLTGIGRSRLVIALLEGPTIVSQYLRILTRPGETIEVLEDKGNPEYGESRRLTAYYGAGFRHVAAPTKPIVGVVRDKDTKKPLAAVTVRGHARLIKPGDYDARDLDIARTTSDAHGHYRLVGMPKGDGYNIVAIPDTDQPYLATKTDVPNTPGLDPVTVDFELKRGIWIEGKITDKVTGKPVKADVQYFSLYTNPNLRDYEGFGGTFLIDHLGVGGKEDGSYRVIGIPGPGIVAVWAVDNYLRANERDDGDGTKETSLNTAPYAIFPSLGHHSALARIEPTKGTDPARRDVTLDPGWTFTGKVIGPDDKPLAGARGFGIVRSPPWDQENMKSNEFTVSGFNPRMPRDVFFQHTEKGLVGVVQPPKENGGSVTVRMVPGATVAGRLIDATNQPRAGVELEVLFHPKNGPGWNSYYPHRIQTDRQGRFRIDLLLPGHEFRLSDDKGKLIFGAPGSGQTKDLGDVKIR